MADRLGKLGLLVHEHELAPEHPDLQIEVKSFGYSLNDEGSIKGGITLTPLCNAEQLENYIDWLIEDLEAIRKKVKKGYPHR